MINMLCKRICDNDQFKKDYEELLSVNLKNLVNNEQGLYISQDVENRLLNSISIFSNSKNLYYREIALDILIKLHNNHKVIDEAKERIYMNFLSIVLCNLGNFPSDSMLLKGKNDEYFDVKPPRIWLENEYRKINNTIKIKGKELILTNAQKNIWNALMNNSNVIINAPTSAGKSFILQNFIINLFNNNTKNKIIYIVPTRALIDQVSSGLRELLKSNCIEDVSITGVPIDTESSDRIIYVVTQERAQFVLDSETIVNYLIVDEAQNVNDDARGVILQSVIEKVKNTSYCGCIFATPFVGNPEIFNSLMVNDESLHIVKVKESSVVQNLFDVRKISDSTCKISVIKDNCTISELFEFEDKFDEIKNFTSLAIKLGRNSVNIIYGSTPSVCEKISMFLLEEFSSNNQIPKSLMEASNFIKQIIHEDYLLSETIKYGIVYHYGNLPAVIRNMIEELCKTGDIKYIVCTSTLLQGINLPAQNIFLFKPTKGKDLPLTAHEFWNLVGRAGRLTKDFEGNVFLINLNDWQENPLLKNRYVNVTFSFNTYIKNYSNGLKQFILNKEHASDNEETQGYENVLNKLYVEYKNNTINETLLQIGLENDKIDEIINDISVLDPLISLPVDILNKNPNVSFVRQQELFNYIENGCRYGAFSNLIPLPPQKKFNDIYDWYLNFVKLLLKLLKKVDSKVYRYITAKLLLWMQGVSYKELLENNISYNNSNRKKGQANVNTEARNLFRLIERDIRYSYVKMTKCYTDLLAYAFEINDLTENIKRIPRLHLYLELGACNEIQILLLSMGLSRTSAVEVSKKLLGSYKSTEEIRNYLRNTNLRAIGLHEIVINEINKFIL